MTTIAIDLSAITPASMAKALRTLAEWSGVATSDRENIRYLAGAIEAAADRPIIVLDVDELGLHPETDAQVLLDSATVLVTGFALGAKVCRAVADALDSLTPPRPPEPTGLGAVVRDGQDEVWVLASARGWHNQDHVHLNWKNIPDPIEILNHGVGGAS